MFKFVRHKGGRLRFPGSEGLCAQWASCGVVRSLVVGFEPPNCFDLFLSWNITCSIHREKIKSRFKERRVLGAII